MADQRITMYGATWCSDCKRAKKFLGEQRVHYHWVDVEQDADGLALVERVNDGKRIIPTIAFDDGSYLVEPSNAELASKLGLQTRGAMSYYDLIVVGGGPAGLTAALYAAREGLDVLLIERSGLGGQAGRDRAAGQLPGLSRTASPAAEFADRLALQARRFGVEILQAQDVLGLRAEEQYRVTSAPATARSTARGGPAGAPARPIAGSVLPGEDDLIGAGVHFCATCDGPFYRDQEMMVVGGGNSAAEEAVFLTRFASRVTMLIRGPSLGQPDRRSARSPTIPRSTSLRHRVHALRGEGKLSGVTIRGPSRAVRNAWYDRRRCSYSSDCTRTPRWCAAWST